MLALRGPLDAPKRFCACGVCGAQLVCCTSHDFVNLLELTLVLCGHRGSLITLSLSRTGGGPPAAESSQRKKRGTENIEHGGEATTAA
eukprot:3224016-Pleurochrysis_carterae.AAC.2